MGTDLYMSWDNMTEDEKKARYTGYRSAGKVGYLRASIGMVSENSVLRAAFPEEYWRAGKELPYDFEANYTEAVKCGIAYVVSILTGKELPRDEIVEQQIGMANKVMEMLGKANHTELKGMPRLTNLEDFPFAISWLNSFIEFFELGIEKQKAGLNPTIHISW